MGDNYGSSTEVALFCDVTILEREELWPAQQ